MHLWTILVSYNARPEYSGQSNKKSEHWAQAIGQGKVHIFCHTVVGNITWILLLRGFL